MLFGILISAIYFFITVIFSGYATLIISFVSTLTVVTISYLFSRITKPTKTTYLTQRIIILVLDSKYFMELSCSFLNSSIINTIN